MRNIVFQKDEYYHVYNRGVDKRSIFQDSEDLHRFLYCMRQFNSVESIGSIYASSFKKLRSPAPQLVRFTAYCLNQNHFHFIIEPLVDDGVQRFMHKLSTGYTNYFNEKYERSGSLFQGKYKAIHIETNDYLLHLSAYVNLNDRAHPGLNESWMEKMPYSSFNEYHKEKKQGQMCDVSVVLDQFNSREKYVQYAMSALSDIQVRKEVEKGFKKALIE